MKLRRRIFSASMPASDALFDTLFLSLGRLNFTSFFFCNPFPFRRSSSPTARCFPSYDMKKFFRRNPLPIFFLPPHRTKKILTKPTKKSIIKHILCGYVGTGRQDGLRIRWETVQVRALLSAPREKTVILMQTHRYHGLFFLRIDLFSLRP